MHKCVFFWLFFIIAFLSASLSFPCPSTHPFLVEISHNFPKIREGRQINGQYLARHVLFPSQTTKKPCRISIGAVVHQQVSDLLIHQE